VVCGAGIAIGGGVPIISTTSAMPSATASMTWKPTATGLKNEMSGKGDGCVSVTAVLAEACGHEATLDASPMTTAAITDTTATPTDRDARSTRESCRKNHSRHSENARCYRAATIDTGRKGP
jgi:hypothetical protein